MENTSLNLLYDRIRSSDKLAFDKLYKQMNFRLYTIAESVLRNPMLSEEVVSDVFIQLWMDREKRTIQNIFTYLYIATRNKALDMREKELRHTSCSIDDIEQQLLFSSLTPERELISREQIKLILNIIRSLPEKRRTAFILAKYHNLKYAEIAEVMNISIKTVEKHLSEALKNILQQIDRHQDGEINKNKAIHVLSVLCAILSEQLIPDWNALLWLEKPSPQNESLLTNEC
ncbi:MAG: RNA polymerase sigma factor [Bacteroidales bacterium]